ncbi:MAG: extracellular solute-binding protein, partial [Mesorhizobium sp.]
MTNGTKKHSIEALSARAARGEISRRQFTQLAAYVLAGTPMLLRSTGAFAQAKELVLVNWGGDAITAYDAAYGQAFTKETGIPVKMDGSGPTEGAIAAQFKSGAPTWDLVDVDPFSAITLGAQGMLEPIDYSIVDRKKMREGFG